MELTLDLMLKVALSAVLGAVLGIERSRAGQSAGIRTNMMIAVASCLFTFLGTDVFATEGVGPQDTARVAAQVVSGVGFLGAGTLLQTKNKIRGLTTAATIWLVAAIGMAVGAGLYLGAILVTIFAIIALIVLAPVSHHLEEMAQENQKVLKMEQRRKREELKHWWGEQDDDDDDDGDEHVTVED